VPRAAQRGVRLDIRRKSMRQMDRLISNTLLIVSAMIFLFLVTGSVFSHPEEKAEESKAVFYVA